MSQVIPEQFTSITKANIDVAMNLSNIALNGTERLTALNLNALRSALEDYVAYSKAAFAVKEAQELPKLQSSFSEPAKDKAMAYSRDLQECAATTQQELSNAMKSYLADIAKCSASSSRGWGPAFDLFEKAGQQFASIAEANIKAVAQTSDKVAAAAQPHVKKAA